MSVSVVVAAKGSEERWESLYARGGDRFTTNKMFLGYVAMWEPCQDHVGTMLGPCPDHVGVMFGPS